MAYKYFGNPEFQNDFLNQGRIYFNSLSYFLTCEDKQRQDRTEHTNLYKPSDGLKVTTVNPQQTLIDERALISTVRRPDRIFVFCTSTEYSKALIERFNASGCVEILDLTEFRKRLQTALDKKIRLGIVKNKTLLSGNIDYYDSESEPGARHACPDKIIMSKPIQPFSIEKEYRFAFAKDKNAFDVNEINYYLAHQAPPYVGQNAHQTLEVGKLTDICRVLI